MIAKESIWRVARGRRFPKLAKTGQFDVVVVGGGITGLTAAYQLKRAGKRVCVLERDRIGFVDTGNTTGHLTYVTDLRLSKLVKTFGRQAAAQLWWAGVAAIDAIEATVNELQIECNFRRVPGFLVAPLFKAAPSARPLQRDAQLAAELGLPARFQAAVPFFNRPGVHFPDQALFHPLKYLHGLALEIHGEGSAVYEGTEVKKIRDDPLAVKTATHEVRTDYVVIATHVPLMGTTSQLSAALFQSKLFPYTSYAVGAKVPRGLVPQASFWDTSDPYYYLRVEPGRASDYVIFGGEDHKTGQETDTRKRFLSLRAALLKLIPAAQIDRQWSGQVVETADGLPYIGETSERQFVATGFSGNGMTLGTLAGLLAHDAVVKRENPLAALFSVSRKKLRGGFWNYVVENLDFPYYYLKDRLKPSRKSSLAPLKRGAGQIIDIEGEKVACACDQNGTIHAVSAYCTHLGCLVRWNQAEQTWDCPCHGSRFKADGKVLAGPAEEPLEPATVPAKKLPASAAKRQRIRKPKDRSAARSKSR